MGKFQFYSVRVLEVDRIVAFRVSGIFLRPPIEDRDVLWLQILFVELVYGLPRVCVKSNMVYANPLPMISVLSKSFLALTYPKIAPLYAPASFFSFVKDFSVS